MGGKLDAEATAKGSFLKCFAFEKKLSLPAIFSSCLFIA